MKGVIIIKSFNEIEVERICLDSVSGTLVINRENKILDSVEKPLLLIGQMKFEILYRNPFFL